MIIIYDSWYQYVAFASLQNDSDSTTNGTSNEWLMQQQQQTAHLVRKHPQKTLREESPLPPLSTHAKIGAGGTRRTPDSYSMFFFFAPTTAKFRLLMICPRGYPQRASIQQGPAQQQQQQQRNRADTRDSKIRHQSLSKVLHIYSAPSHVLNPPPPPLPSFPHQT